MDLQLYSTPLVIPIGFSILLTIALLIVIRQQHENLLTFLAQIFMIEVLFWHTMSLLELITLNIPLRLFFADLSFLGITFLPVTWLNFVLTYVDAGLRYRQWARWSYGLPVLTNIIIWTNPLHGLWRGNSSLDLTSTWFPTTVYEYGIWYDFFHVPLAYIFVLIATIWLLKSLFGRNTIYRAQIVGILVALYLPLIVDIAHRFGFDPIPQFNASPLVFPISGLLIAWLILRGRFLNLSPIARDRVIENMDSLMVVLDRAHQIVDVNPAAQKYLGHGQYELIGQHISQILREEPELIERIVSRTSLREEIMLGIGESCRNYDLQMSPIIDQTGIIGGRLLLLNDITIRKQTERQLSEQARQVVLLEERQRIAQELHDSVNQALFAASALADLMPRVVAEKPEKLNEYITNMRQITHGATAQMRLILLELYPQALEESDFGTTLRNLCLAFTGETGIPIDLEIEIAADLERDVRVALYRIVQESFHNIRKYASASQIRVKCLCYSDRFRLIIEDNGTGFDPDQTPAGHFGLQNMQQRSMSIGAQIEFDSKINHGTRIIVKKDWI